MESEKGGKSGGGTSAPIAHKILAESLAVENGYDPGIVPLEPRAVAAVACAA